MSIWELLLNESDAIKHSVRYYYIFVCAYFSFCCSLLVLMHKLYMSIVVHFVYFWAIQKIAEKRTVGNLIYFVFIFKCIRYLPSIRSIR